VCVYVCVSVCFTAKPRFLWLRVLTPGPKPARYASCMIWLMELCKTVIIICVEPDYGGHDNVRIVSELSRASVVIGPC